MNATDTLETTDSAGRSPEGLATKSCSGRVVVYGGVGNAQRMAALSLAVASSCELVLLPSHLKAALQTPEELLIKAMDEIKIPPIGPLGLKVPKRQRTHPNEPFYRTFKKRRQW